MKSIIFLLQLHCSCVALDCHGPYGLIDCTKPDGTPLVAGLEVTAFTDAEEKAAGAWDWVMGNAKSMEQVFTEQGATFVVIGNKDTTTLLPTSVVDWTTKLEKWRVCNKRTNVCVTIHK